MTARALAWLASVPIAVALAACPTTPPDGPSRFDPSPLVAKPGYCPELIEQCPADSHPVTGVRAVTECSDPKNMLADGWTKDPHGAITRYPHIVGQCLQQGDCLVFCRLSATCQATSITPTALTCLPPTCGAENCELDLGERHRCDLPGSPTNCVACPADCPSSCEDGVTEPGEICDPCTPGASICSNNTTYVCNDNGVGYFIESDCAASGLECRMGECRSPCGNGRCSAGETAANCPADCACTGNGGKCVDEDLFFCTAGTWTFQQDCDSVPGRVCFSAGNGATCTTPICGNGTCDVGETHASCPAECP